MVIWGLATVLRIPRRDGKFPLNVLLCIWVFLVGVVLGVSVVVLVGYGVRCGKLPAGKVKGVIPWGVLLQVGVYVCESLKVFPSLSDS